jgi:hypothetical protein
VTGVAAQDLRGFLGSSFGGTMSESSDGRTVELLSARQSLDLSLSRPVTPFLSYRLMLRGDKQDSWSEATGVPATETSSVLLQPAGELTLASPFYSLSGGFRLREQFVEASGGRAGDDSRHTSDRNVFARFFWNPVAFPSVSLLFDRTTGTDDRVPPGRDLEETRWQLSTTYTIADVALLYGFAYDIREDAVARRTQRGHSHHGGASYATTLFGNMLALQASAAASHAERREKFLAPGTVAIAPPVQGRPVRAEPDPTPADSSDVPVVPATGDVALVEHAAIGVDFPVRVTVAEIVLSLAAVPPLVFPPDLTALLDFRMFATDDPTLRAWTEVAVVAESWDPALNRFTVGIPATTARAFKVWVSVNPFGGLVLATAGAVAAADVVRVARGTERVTRASSQSVTGSLSFAPIPALAANYNFVLALAQSEPGALETISGTHAVGVTGRLHRLLTATGTYQYSFAGTNQALTPETAATTMSVSLNSVPLPPLSATLTVARSEIESDGERQARTDAGSLNVGARLLPGLNADAVVSLARSSDRVTGRDTLSQGAALSATAQLTRRLNAVVHYAIQRQETTPPLAGLDPVVITHSGGVGTTYTLSRVLNLTTRLDVGHSAAGTFMASTAKVNWIPTYKTSVFASYRYATQDATNVTGTSDAAILGARWSVSRAIDLSADYSLARTSTRGAPAASGGPTGVTRTTQSFNLAGGVRF